MLRGTATTRNGRRGHSTNDLNAGPKAGVSRGDSAEATRMILGGI